MSTRPERRPAGLSELVRNYDRLRTQTAELSVRADEHYEQLRDLAAENEHLREVLRTVLTRFTEKGHPGRPCLRTDWVYVEQVERWREAIDGEPALPTVDQP